MYRTEATGILTTILSRSITEEWPVDRTLSAIQYQLRLVHIPRGSTSAQFLCELVTCAPKDDLMDGWEKPRPKLLLDEEYDPRYDEYEKQRHEYEPEYHDDYEPED